MIKGLQTSALRRLNSLLKDAVEITNSAIAERASLIDYHGYTSLSRARADSVYDPEPYFNFVVLDKGVSISRPKKGSYTVKTHGWRSTIDVPDCKDLRTVFSYFSLVCCEFIAYLDNSKEDLF